MSNEMMAKPTTPTRASRDVDGGMAISRTDQS
jgi:hypothetical protein